MGLRLEISSEKDETRLLWSDESETLDPYWVDRSRLVEASTKIREVLTGLSTHYRTNDPPSYREFMAPLRQAGAQLQEALFTVERGAQDNADNVLEMLADTQDANAPKHESLSILSDASVHVPWNFVYLGNPWEEMKLKGNSLDDFCDFWLTRFQVTTRFNRYKGKGGLLRKRTVRPRDNFRVLYALDKAAYGSARQNLPSEEIARFENLLAYEVGSVTTWEDCGRKWRSIDGNDSILYFFGHSDGNTMFFEDTKGKRKHLNSSTFYGMFRKSRRANSATICILNGCQTAAGREGRGFLELTSGHGFRGFVGTEAEVSNNFATLYGSNFMYRMCEQGKSVQDTMRELLVELFPLSILYSCFAHPEFRIEPPDPRRTAQI